MRFVAVVTILMLSIACGARAEDPYVVGVTKIIDGDTFRIHLPWNQYQELSWTVRVRGLDTPEKGSRANCAKEARLAERASLFTLSRIVESEYRVRISNLDHDKYGGRILADVTLSDGRDLASLLIAEGLARPYHGERKKSWCSR